MNQLIPLGEKAKKAELILKQAPTAQKNKALLIAAEQLRAQKPQILNENEKDLAAHKHLSNAQKDRLRLDPNRLENMAAGLEQIAARPDPVGKAIAEWTVPNGLRFIRRSVPIGVIGIIYESRPNVTSDAAGLCLKSGNACLLRPGNESFHTSLCLATIFRQSIDDAGIPQDCVQILPSADRALVGDLLRLNEYVDLIIPRGGASLIRYVSEETRIPILAHLSGNCHVYVDQDADLDMARQIVMNAKMRRPGICGAAETLLIHRNILMTHARPLLSDLIDAGCEIRADRLLRDTIKDLPLKEATDLDWSTEYLDTILAVRAVDSVEQAIEHIQHHGSGHTESIVTNNNEVAAQFLDQIDSAIVMHNASTQFADGGEFGMGAEIGIATGRLHARGPVGLNELTTYKTIVLGKGQVRKP